MSEVGKNPNDNMPDGKPLDPDRIVSGDDAGSAEIEKEAEAEFDDQVVEDEFDGLDNDLVNVGKFTDDASEEEMLRPIDNDEDQPGLA